jgi:hypothetical protein
MPIRHDDANITIEFAWQSDETEEKLLVKHYVQDGIPTISVSDDGKEWYHFPAAFFKEVTDFLGQQKAFKPTPARSLRSPQAPPSFNATAPTPGAQSQPSYASGLPIPNIDGSSQEYAEQVGPEPLVTSNTAPLQSFAGMERLAENTSSDRPNKKTRKNELDADMMSRPVIRSADEATSAMLRGGSNPEKTARRIDREE